MKKKKKVMVCSILLYICRGLMVLCVAGFFFQLYLSLLDNPEHSFAHTCGILLIIFAFHELFSVCRDPTQRKKNEDSVGSIPLQILDRVIGWLWLAQFFLVLITLFFPPEDLISSKNFISFTLFNILIGILYLLYNIILKRKKKKCQSQRSLIPRLAPSFSKLSSDFPST